MEQYISYSPPRRECWKGHATKAGVRRAIGYARRHPWAPGLRLFVSEHSPTGVILVEIPAAEWDETFTEGEA